jgi:hypothetical protein
MTATSQAFVASDVLSTPGFFTAAIGADDNINPFEASFKARTATLERGHDSYPRHHDHRTPDFTGLSNNTNTTHQSIKPDCFSPLFAFSPRMSPVPYENNQFRSSKAVDVPAPVRWGPCKQENSLQLDLQSAVQLQALSPPNSVKHSPDRWQFNDLPQPIYSQLHRILTHSPHGRTRAEYGQVTPPNDRSPEDGDRHRDEHEEQFMESGRASKRKRGSPSSQPAEVADKNPSKRPRKSVAHSNPQFFGASETSAPPVEDPKRSKFLERNRVAASKCRQKKKEWTSNLEVRARDLQSAKNQLTVVVTSLKEEIIFLKGEMLKHSSCGCTAIKDYLNREVASMSQSVYDRGHLPSIVPTVEKSSADDDTVDRTGTVVDDDGTATSPDSTLADLETTSVLSSEHINRENSTLDEVLAGGG